MKTYRENPIWLLGINSKKTKLKLAVGKNLEKNLTIDRQAGRPPMAGFLTVRVRLGRPNNPTREPSSLTVDRSVDRDPTEAKCVLVGRPIS